MSHPDNPNAAPSSGADTDSGALDGTITCFYSDDEDHEDDTGPWQDAAGPDPIDVPTLAPGDVIFLGDTHGGAGRHGDHGTGRRVLHVDPMRFPAAGLDAESVPGYAVWHDGLTGDVVEPEDGAAAPDPTVMMLWIPADAGPIHGYRCPSSQVFATSVRLTRSHALAPNGTGDDAQSLDLELAVPAVVSLTLRPRLDMTPGTDPQAAGSITTVTEISMLICPSNAPGLLPWLGAGSFEALHFAAWTDLTVFTRTPDARPGTMWGCTALAGPGRADLTVDTTYDQALLRWQITDPAPAGAVVLTIDPQPPAFVRASATDAQSAAGAYGWMGENWQTPPEYNDEAPF